MPEATLRIKTEGGPEVARLVADLERALAASQARVERGARASRQRTVRETVAQVNAQAGAYRAGAATIERVEQLVTRSKLRELARQGEAAKRWATLYADAHKRATAALEAEVGKRGNLTDREQHQVETLALAMVATHEQAERARTRATEQEARKRERASAQEATRRAADERRAAGEGRAAGRRVGEAVVGVGRAAVGVGTAVHGQIQDARQRGAALQSTVMGTVEQVGVTDLGEVNTYVRELRTAQQTHGIDAQTLAEAINAAQTEFSTLGGMEGERDPAARMAVFQRAIGTAVRGRNLGADPGEFSRMMGMLNQQGFDASTQEFLAAWTTGASFNGAVEQGSVTRDAMAPIMRRVAAAMSQAAPGQAQTAGQQAYMQAFAELQVLRGQGETVRAAGNNMAGLSTVLTNPGNVRRMLGNVEALQDRGMRGRVREALFDRAGNLRAQMRNPLYLSAALANAGMNDPIAAANLFAGTGAGNPMGLQSNFRRMLGALNQRNAAGQTGAARVEELMRAETALSPERQAAMARMHEGSDAANLSRAEGSHDAALTDNTTAINQLSNRIADWARANPMAAQAAGAGGDLLGGLAGSLVPKALGAAGATRAGRAVLGAVAPAAANPVVAAGIAATLVGTAGTADLIAGPRATRSSRAGAIAQMAMFGPIGMMNNALVAGASRLFGGGGGASGGGGGPVQVQLSETSAAAVGTHTAQALQRAGGVPVQTSQHDAVHRDTQRASPAGRATE